MSRGGGWVMVKKFGYKIFKKYIWWLSCSCRKVGGRERESVCDLCLLFYWGKE